MVQDRLTDYRQELGEETRQLTELSVDLEETAHHQLLGNKHYGSVKANLLHMLPFLFLLCLMK